ncbi:MAG: alanine--tRNA ligase-related protein [bacterium]|nr:alanine--tRNA ligase-related protein [bacterium]
MSKNFSSNELRKKYLEFYQAKGHAVIPSSALIPENDPSTLFTGSGMQPLVPYLLGEKHPAGTKLVDSQQCFRVTDIEEVGDNRHTTFFEMLGNWSFGDYFKEEQISWLFKFLTEEVQLDPKRIYVTTFFGDSSKGIPKDEIATGLWQKLFAEKGIEAKQVDLDTEERAAEVGMQGGRIFYYGVKKNWWSRSGVPDAMPPGEPGGPDSEIFFEFPEIEHDPKYGKFCHPNCDCGRYMEIGNSVFMQYKKEVDGSFLRLVQQNVDFGGSIERILAAINDNPDVFVSVDNLWAIIEILENKSDKKYVDSIEAKKSFRVIADHMRAVVFLLSNGILPSNTDRGYVLRRLIRRMVRHADLLGIQEGILSKTAKVVVDCYSNIRPILTEQLGQISQAIQEEEEKFRKTLKSGLREFSKRVIEENKKSLNGEEAFYFYQSFGFPIEVMRELCQENIIVFSEEEFKKEFEKHQDLSRLGTDKKFAGGLADQSVQTTKLHTATHLLHASLRKVLGEHVGQKGSNITAERLRFDFSHPTKMTPEQVKQVEDMVNEQIKRALPVTKEIMTPDRAKESGALGFFTEKYGDQVSVYSMGDFSKEICGGPHVENTSELISFKIIKEEAVSAGIRRIKATVGL